MRGDGERERRIAETSQRTGGHVRLLPNWAHLLGLVGSDGAPVFLYKFVEALDESVDYEDLHREFPNLTYTQISGALAFLRRMTQFNSRGLDIDDLESRIAADDEHLIANLRRALREDRRERRIALSNDWELGEARFSPTMMMRLENACARFRGYAAGPHDAGRLVVEALEARLDALEAVGK